MNVKAVSFAASLSMFLIVVSPHACTDVMSKYYAGAVLTNQESVDFSRMQAMGVEGVNYFRVCDTAASTANFSCSYRYRCHSVENAMVYLGFFTLGYQSVQPCPRIAVYFDTAIVPTAGQKADAVAAELRWLAARNIVTGLSDVKIVRMQSALALNPQQYWTLQDTVLAYNMWFTGGIVTGVYSVNGVRGGCGLGASYNLPSQPLGPITAIAMPGKSGNTQTFRIINNRSQTILQLPYALEANAFIKVYNLNGAMIALIKGPSGSRAIEWDRRGFNGQRINPGRYIFAWEGASTNRRLLLVGP